MHVIYEVFSLSGNNDDLERLLEMASFYVHKQFHYEVFENNHLDCISNPRYFADHLAIFKFLCGVTGKPELYDSFVEEVNVWAKQRSIELEQKLKSCEGQKIEQIL